MENDYDFEKNFAKKRKIKLMLIGGILFGVIITASVVFITLWANQPEPLCKQEDARIFIKESRMGVGALRMVCDFPEPLDNTLKQIDSSPPGWESIISFKLISEHPTLVTDVCGDGVEGILEATKITPQKQSEKFLEYCDLDSLKITSTEEIRRAPLHKVILAIAVYGSLKDSDPDLSKKLAKRVLTSQ